MNGLRLIWFFVWRMVGWMISSGVAVGVLVALLIEIPFYAGGGAGEVVGALGRDALIGCSFGVVLGAACGLALAVLTLAVRLPERPAQRLTAAAVCAGVAVVPAILLALLPESEYCPGCLFVPTYFQLVGIPLLISAPFCAFAGRRVGKVYSRRARVG